MILVRMDDSRCRWAKDGDGDGACDDPYDHEMLLPALVTAAM